MLYFGLCRDRNDRYLSIYKLSISLQFKSLGDVTNYYEYVLRSAQKGRLGGIRLGGGHQLLINKKYYVRFRLPINRAFAFI